MAKFVTNSSGPNSQVMVKFKTDPIGATCNFRDYSVTDLMSGSVVPLEMFCKSVGWGQVFRTKF